ncbi:MAG: hypothetical protein KKE86_02835 [Planctomycetes bacterium]|nr:hypothetical protein [Planctomycetota bacterium]
MLLVITNLCFGVFRAAAAGPQIAHDSDKKLVTMADAENHLVLRLNYDGRCTLDRVVVRGEEVVPPATGVCSSIRLGTAEHTTRSGLKSPKVAVADNTVTVSEIRFGGSGVDVEETWSFTVQADRIVWRIARKYLTGGTLDDTGFPGWDFTSPSTWTGALLGTGGVAWFRLFDTPTATYGVHTGPVTFWNRDNGVCLRIVPTVPEGRHAAVRFSRQPRGTLSFNYCVTDQELAAKHGHSRFLRDKQDVWASFKVVPGETAVEYTLSGLDYAEAYDRGVFKGIDGAAVREICNTIARLGVIDAKIIGSNGWYSGSAVLQEQWLAQLGLPINDPAYVRNYTETLDYQRDNAIGPDGRVKPRWSYGPGDDMPGTYDRFGFYECQWGYMLDSQPDWVINVSEQFDFTGDLDWLRSHKSTCERVLDYMLRRDSNNNGLVEVMTDTHAQQKGCDWLDIVWVSFEAASINAQMYHALVLWADCEELLGDLGHAAKYRAAANKLKASFNKTTANGGFWNPDRKWYVHWRNKDGAVHGDNLVLMVNFMAIAYGVCDDSSRRDAILGQTEAEMKKEGLFFWPTCIYSYEKDEGHSKFNWPFPSYENGDIFLAWGEVATRAYAQYDPAIAVRYVKNVLDQYAKDGLAFQRYQRRSQTGAGNDILSNMSSPVVGLYRNIYGVQPKWNRLYLEPHLTPELNGTRLKYWLRDQWYTIDLDTRRCRIAVNDFSVSAAKPLAVNAKGDTLEYFCGNRKTFSMAVTRSVPASLELRIDAWPSAAAGLRKWTETAAQDGMTVSHVVSDLVPGAEYTLFRNGARVTTVRSDAAGNIAFEVAISDSQPQTYELKR